MVCHGRHNLGKDRDACMHAWGARTVQYWYPDDECPTIGIVWVHCSASTLSTRRMRACAHGGKASDDFNRRPSRVPGGPVFRERHSHRRPGWGWLLVSEEGDGRARRSSFLRLPALSLPPPSLPVSRAPPPSLPLLLPSASPAEKTERELRQKKNNSSHRSPTKLSRKDRGEEPQEEGRIYISASTSDDFVSWLFYCEKGTPNEWLEEERSVV